MSTKVIIAGIIGGIASFLVGYLIWGILLSDTMEAYSNPGCMKSDEEMNIYLIFVAQLVWGFFYAYVFSKWASITSFSSGAMAGVILSILTGLGIDLMFYATTNMMTSVTGIAIDLAANAVLGVVVGGLIGWWLGRGSAGSRGSGGVAG